MCFPCIKIWHIKKNQIRISGKILISTPDGGYIKTENYNSYACAYITAWMSKKNKKTVDKISKRVYKLQKYR